MIATGLRRALVGIILATFLTALPATAQVDAQAPTPVRGESAHEDPVLQNLSPRLSWIREQGMRIGYCRVRLDWYPRAAEAGLNAIITRLEIANDPSGDEMIADQAGADDVVAVREWRHVRPSSRAARDAGLRFFYMLNPGAMAHTIEDGLRDNPRRFNNGEIFSALDDIYWTRTIENRFLRVARMLQGSEYQIDGFLIDPEMYALGARMPGQGGLDYGDFALGAFAEEAGVELDFADLPIAERRQLIAQLGLEEDFARFHFERVRQMAETTRKRVQEIVPDAILGFFRVDFANYWHWAVAKGFSTPEVPAWVGLEGTYPGHFDEGLLAHMEAVKEKAGVPLLLSPGTALPGSRLPRYMSSLETAAAGNLYHRGINSTGGYWFWALRLVFGHLSEQEAQPFVDMLKLVNGEMDKYYASGRTYRSHLRPRPFPVEQPRDIGRITRQVAEWLPVPEEALPRNAPAAWGFSSRGRDVVLAVPAESDDALSFTIRNHRLAHYSSPTYANLFRPDGAVLEFEPIQVADWAERRHTADSPGVWVLAVSSGPGAVHNAFSVLPKTRSAVLVPSDGVLVMFGCHHARNNTIFFYVPRECRSFDVRLGGAAALRLFNASGEAVLEHSAGVSKALIVDEDHEHPLVQPGDDGLSTIRVTEQQRGRVWWIRVSEARWGSYRVGLEGIPAVFAMRPEQLLVPEL